ncbi:hypothetical protein Bca52824_007451 [Brassica carinata]|uniref:non-specific serine/threonine protein kinase n=1 Tax=Brassica carinata TaxID=52824 RepID=A0A8X7W6A0_BRACI|nr:hypothetical protein Bca52824_007451 [Brassica carinata]
MGQYGPHRFAYKELYNATNGFKEKQLLGRGGFGQVYKGTLPGSDAEIAVKRTSHDSRHGMREFLAEISTIGRLRHPNLVRLLGYFRHKEHLYLVYDFMPNGSLDKYLYRNNENQERLTWETRFKIIKNVASALLYLHQEWVQVIIHRDIKPANVLLDHEMNARLGDFGLAKMYDQGFDPQTSKVAGTFGEQVELVLKLGVLCSHQGVSIRPAMSTVMQFLDGVSQLMDNLLDVMRDEKLRGLPETSMETLLGLNSSTITNSLVSHGR